MKEKIKGSSTVRKLEEWKSQNKRNKGWGEVISDVLNGKSVSEIHVYAMEFEKI